MKRKELIILLSIYFSPINYPQALKAQSKDTVSTVKARPEKADNKKPDKITSYIAPAALIGYGLVSLESKALRNLDYSIHSGIQKSNPGFKSGVDDYLQYTPALAAYGLNLSGIHGKNNFIDGTATLLISYALMGTSVTLVKKSTHRLRPNGTAYNSFPSGHTATAFAGAEFLWQEYKDVSPWYGIAGYTAATATGVLRMYNNAHWFSDVLAGAGFGILSTKISYLAYPYIKHKLTQDKPLKIIAVPNYQEGITGLLLVRRF